MVDRNMLLDIQGRSRRRQKELARKYGLTDYPQPGGGCMLTNEGFSNRLRKLLGTRPSATVEDVEIIKWGRAFILSGKTICMVGVSRAKTISWTLLPEHRIFSCGPSILPARHAFSWRRMDMRYRFGRDPAGHLQRRAKTGAGRCQMGGRRAGWGRRNQDLPH